MISSRLLPRRLRVHPFSSLPAEDLSFRLLSEFGGAEVDVLRFILVMQTVSEGADLARSPGSPFLYVRARLLVRKAQVASDASLGTSREKFG